MEQYTVNQIVNINFLQVGNWNKEMLRYAVVARDCGLHDKAILHFPFSVYIHQSDLETGHKVFQKLMLYRNAEDRSFHVGN